MTSKNEQINADKATKLGTYRGKRHPSRSSATLVYLPLAT